MDKQVATTKVQLPAGFADKLAAGIAESRASTIINAGGMPLLRLLKDGSWVFGQGDEEVQANSRWLVNVMTIAHGYCCWIDGALRGETMKSVFEPKPVQPPAIEGFPYKEQRSFNLKCLDGDDAGTEVLYKVSSVGGMAMSDKIFQALQTRVTEDQTFIFPAVVLDNAYYNHKQHGRIYTPIMEIVGWHDQNGNEQPAKNGKLAAPVNEAQMAGEEASAAPAQRKRKAPLGSAAPTEEPQTTQQAHASPARRRPGR